MYNNKDKEIHNMEKSNFPELDAGLDTEVIGYNKRRYSLYELRNSANNYKTGDPQEYRSQIRDKYARIYNCKEQNVPLYLLEEVYGLDSAFEEKWEAVPGWFYSMYEIALLDYKASNLGRIKVNDTILEQEAYQDGYLVISSNNSVPGVNNHSVNIYTFISAAFLGKPDGRVVHHINNNGYDCRPDNLILLSPREHSKSHGRYVGTDKRDVCEN